MVDEKVDENKRRFLKALTGGIAGLSIPMSIYEGAIIPELERRLIKELEYWSNEYKNADENLKKLQSNYKSTKDTLSNFEQFENELNEQIKLYNQMKDEAINKMKETINKYEILGIEVSFEKNAVKILEDLKIKGDKLLKSYKHLPAIVDLYWRPIKVINDKIYDINVTFEVDSPLNSLKEVEVMLIPVEYRYFITSYGMREEDYDKVFPKEEIRSVKIEPKKLEREMFSVDFKDLKGGREYIIKARVEDVAGNKKMVEVKTPYIRQFENIAKTDDLLIGAHYFTWYTTNSWVRDTSKTTIHTPLLGMYTSEDPLIFDKHADWATGHGIDFFIIEWASPNVWVSKNLKDNLLKNSQLLNSGQIKFCITYDLDGSSELGRLLKTNDGKGNNWFNYGFDMNNNYNVRIFLEDFSYFSQFFEHPHYLKIDGKPVVFIYGAMKLRNAESVISEVREKYNPILLGQLVAWYPQKEIENRIVPLFPLFDGVYAYNMVGGTPERVKILLIM